MSLEDLLVNTVDITTYGDPKEVGGLNVPDQTVTAGVPCSIQQESIAASTNSAYGPIAQGRAFFDRDPGVRANDILCWGARTLQCVGPASDEAGRGVLFAVKWVESL